MREQPGQLSQGAYCQSDGSVLWRVWAPFARNVSLVTFSSKNRKKKAEMAPQEFGYFTYLSQAKEGLLYSYKLSDGHEYPDPASRWQTDGVHLPSALFFPESYQWSDAGWRGISRDDLIIYELHAGTFTPEGTLDAVIPRLEQLSELGVTAIELMPIAQFPGERNWGYDGVHPFAVQNSYGGPRAFQRLVDAAHNAGLAVILDVVYNHIGPEGNYLAKFGPYFTDHYRTPWGKAINFDGPDSDHVRQFFIDNACSWVRDFHVDGLRLDAVQTIYDFSARHILADIKTAVEEVAQKQNRIVHVIAETNQNDVRLIAPPERGGYGLDGLWSDDFHHAVHSLLTGEGDGYYQDFGGADCLVKTLNEVFVYDGCYSQFRRRRHGTKADTFDRTHFVVCVQNHDQVGNRARGDRLGSIVSPSMQRLSCGLLLLSPFAPLMFMGEEYGEQRPFPFFCSFTDPRLIEAVRRGRRDEFAALKFKWEIDIPDPQSPDTFAAAKIAWSWPEGSFNAQLRLLYKDLLAARRKWPALKDRSHTVACMVNKLDSAENTDQAGVMSIERGKNGELLAVANLSAKSLPLPLLELEGKRPIISTEDVGYGGERNLNQPLKLLFPYELIVFGK
jgi:maltooligosyltrehalose trehalohydrolase